VRGDFAGILGLAWVPSDMPFAPAVELLYRLIPRFWGQGLATEGSLAALEFGFCELHLDIVVAYADIEDAVMVTENIALEYARLAHVVATIGDQEVARVLYRGFGALLDQYDVPRGFSGTISTWDFDFIKFHGHEMFTILTACLIREGRWELIADLLAEAIPRNRSGSCFF